MSEVWTSQRVIGLAPDASSVKAGQAQSKLTKWVSTGRTEVSLWGEVQGSGKKPYQVRIDLHEPAFKCSCPSRKFPCKHALGLMLILAEQHDKIPLAAEAPDWVTDWFESREQRAVKREQRAKEKADKPVDAEAQKKRLAKREEKVAGGIDELDRFLVDLMRGGLASAQSSSENECERVAARMVDAQAPGLARLVGELAAGLYGRGDWQRRSLERVGRLRLITRAYRRIATLPEPLREEVKAAVGFTQSTDELLLTAGVSGDWQVVGQVTEDDGRLKTQRSWLMNAETGRPAMILAFAVGNRPLDSGLVLGTRFQGELVFYPGSLALRAIVKSKAEPVNIDTLKGLPCVEALDRYADALSRCPWLERYPLAIQGVVPVHEQASAEPAWRLVNDAGDRVTLATRFDDPWTLRAISGDRPVTVFGEWDGRSFLPLSVWDGERFNALCDIQGAGLARVG